VRKSRTAYGIDYYTGGKKHREIVAPLLTEAPLKLEERMAMAKRGGFISLARQRRITFREFADKTPRFKGEEPILRNPRGIS
jgi:hypothetical protein